VSVERTKYVGYVRSVPRIFEDDPGRNLTGDPFFTNGYRSISFLRDRPVAVEIYDWSEGNNRALAEMEATEKEE
jgi:hypothetical protein